MGNSQDAINAVADLRVDIGLIEGPCHAADIIAEPWLEDELVVFAAPDSPLLEGEVTLQRLAEAPWILREHGSGTREIVDYLLLSHLPAFHLGMELGNSEAIKHAVRHGLGISCPVAYSSPPEAYFQGITAFPELLRDRNLIREVLHRRQPVLNANIRCFRVIPCSPWIRFPAANIAVRAKKGEM